MKTTIIAVLSFVSITAFAAPVESVRVLKDTTTYVPLELTPQTVFCTNRGYGTIQLKVSVPDLDWLAHFDHRVVGETLPCITGGECTDALKPGAILDPNERIAVASIRVVLKEHTQLDRAAHTCKQILEEQIVGQIRGHTFNHSKFDPDYRVADFDKCLKVVPSQTRIRF